MTFEKLLSDAEKKYHALEFKIRKLEDENYRLKALEQENKELKKLVKRHGLPEDIYKQFKTAWEDHTFQHPNGCHYRFAIVEEEGKIHYTLKCSECDNFLRVYQ